MPETIQTEEPKKKIIVEFKHTDELGNPIIDPRTGQQAFTNLVADTPEEMIEKQKEAYINVARALARARNNKPVPKETVAVKEMTPEEQRQLTTEVNDPVKGREAIRKLSGVEDLEARMKRADEATMRANIAQAQYIFVSRHINDYFQCQANRELLVSYINENELDPTQVSNYEIAFQNVQHKLAQRPAPPKVEEPPQEEPKPRQAAGGIQPGELSGRRPIQRKQSMNGDLTVEKIKWMKNTDEGRAEWKRRVQTDPKFYDKVNALLAQR